MEGELLRLRELRLRHPRDADVAAAGEDPWVHSPRLERLQGKRGAVDGASMRESGGCQRLLGERGQAARPRPTLMPFMNSSSCSSRERTSSAVLRPTLASVTKRNGLGSVSFASVGVGGSGKSCARRGAKGGDDSRASSG